MPSILFIRKPNHHIRSYSLCSKELLIGRAGSRSDWQPDINLLDDPYVSRKHAKLYEEGGNWWIEDLGSSNGVICNGKTIRTSREPLEHGLNAWFTVGETVFYIREAGTVMFCIDDKILVEYHSSGYLNYALFHCGIPVLSRLRIWNISEDIINGVSFTVRIPGYSYDWHLSIEKLKPAETTDVPEIHLNLKYERLEGQDARQRAQLQFYMNQELVHSYAIQVLGFYEWPLGEQYRHTLACFVQPSHPLVQNITLDVLDTLAKSHVERSGKYDTSLFGQPVPAWNEIDPDAIVQAVYEYLSNQYDLHYVLEPISFEQMSQVVRPVHAVIVEQPKPGANKGRGQGTCIDLALLVSSCLESLRIQPLLVFVRIDDRNWHALAGYWRQPSLRMQPLIDDFSRFQEKLNNEECRLVDVTGMTLNIKWGYNQAVEKAHDLLHKARFLFALDISAVRPHIVPLQFPIGPEAIKILQRAEWYARREKCPAITTEHLLLSFFDVDQNRILRFISMAKQLSEEPDFDHAPRHSASAQKPRPTLNFQRVLEDAKLIAFDKGVSFVNMDHLFYALLLTQSKSIDRFFEQKFGVSREKIKYVFQTQHREWVYRILETL